MGILNFRKSRNVESTDSDRRSFIWKLGAGASAALASTAGMARAEVRAADDPALRVALLEEEKALRKFHQAFEAGAGQGPARRGHRHVLPLTPRFSSTVAFSASAARA